MKSTHRLPGRLSNCVDSNHFSNAEGSLHFLAAIMTTLFDKDGCGTDPRRGERRGLKPKRFHSRSAVGAMGVSIVRDQLACRDLKRMVIRRLHSQGNGPNWEVECFEPPLQTTSEE
jgi:hypothetical protein